MKNIETQPLTFKNFKIRLPIDSLLMGEGIIDSFERKIYVTIPEAMDKTALTFEFEVDDGVRVWVDDTEQKSGVTVNDFTDDIIYTLEEENRQTAYHVMVNDWRSIQGHCYEGELFQKPERPYQHNYEKTLMMKVAVSEPSGEPNGTKIFLRFEEILDLIEKIDKITREIPKIIYLVGWQYCGHDDKYPAFFEVNPALKRDGDETPRESLIWLMDEALKYHTTVSLHINMTDAYKDSPLWDTYLAHDLISKKDDDTLMDIGEWGNYVKKTAYQVNYTKEWESGFAKKRIDQLLALLPIQRAGTIHVDAFFARASKGHSLEQEKAAKRKICRYWRDCGIDLTTEFLHGSNKGDTVESYTDGTNSGVIGIIPAMWHFNQSLEDYMKRPASLVTGAGINEDIKYGTDKGIPFLFGCSMRGEGIFIHPQNRYGLNPNWEEAFIAQFCLTTLVWQYLNQFERLQLEENDDNKIVTYSQDVTANLKEQVIRQNDTIIRESSDVLVPLAWRKEREMIAFSLEGYENKKWKLLHPWETVENIVLYEIKDCKIERFGECKVDLGCCITLSLQPGQMILVAPKNKE
ncbi:MAG: endo-alpha-N-acetylgalactosaminidase family protein [Cellulosilyticaceae bacterium]